MFNPFGVPKFDVHLPPRYIGVAIKLESLWDSYALNLELQPCIEGSAWRFLTEIDRHRWVLIISLNLEGIEA